MLPASMFDDRHFPLVFLTCPSELTAEWVAELDRGFAKLFARRSRHVVVCDLRPIRRAPDALLRKRLADLLHRADIQQGQRSFQVGSANVVESAPIRAAMTALFWIWPPPVPMYTAADTPDAVRWSLEKLREEGIVLPDSARSYATEMERPPPSRAAR